MWMLISLAWLGLGVYMAFKGFSAAPVYERAEAEAISQNRYADAKGAQDYAARSAGQGVVGLIFIAISLFALYIILASN